MTCSVVALLPNAGLSNKLVVWAKAEAFAHLNDLPARTFGWGYSKIGPMLRGEPSTRMYGRLFDTSAGSASFSLVHGYLRRSVIAEPCCVQLAETEPHAVYLFYKMPHWSDLFGDIRDHRDFVRARLFGIVRKKYTAAIANAVNPVIAIHVRRGDFRALKPGEDFRRVGGVRAPDNYFEGIVENLRAAAGYDAQITVFSDGTDAELSFLLRLPGVKRADPTNEVAEFLLMSKARIFVTSAGSTSASGPHTCRMLPCCGTPIISTPRSAPHRTSSFLKVGRIYGSAGLHQG